MKELFGVLSPIEVFDQPVFENLFKREALMFQRVAIPHLNSLISDSERPPDSPHLPLSIVRHLEWLLEKEVIIGDPDPNLQVVNHNSDERAILTAEVATFEQLVEETDNNAQAYLNSLKKFVQDLKAARDKLVGQKPPKKKQARRNREQDKWSPFDAEAHRLHQEYLKELDVFNELYEKGRLFYGQYLARIASIDYCNCGIEAYPVVYSNLAPLKTDQAKEEQVIQIIIENLPIPDDSTPWEDILYYRSDPNSQKKFLELRRWMNKFAKGQQTLAEARGEIEYLMNEYEEHLRVHKIKTKTILMGVILQIGAACVDEKVGPIASGIATYLLGQVALLEGELKAPGKEVAYIVNTRKRFS